MSKKPNTKDFTLDDIYHILDLAEDSEYTSDTVGGVTYHNFNVLAGEDVQYGEDEVFVEAGYHQLALDAYTSEWMGYYPPSSVR